MSNNIFDPANEYLYHAAKTVLNRRGYHNDIRSLKELADSFEYNKKKILSKIWWYRVSGYVLLITIPILSAIIAVAMNKGEEISAFSLLIREIAPSLSILLVVLTVLNTAFKPGLRFTVCCGIGLKLFHWRLNFLERLEVLEPLDDKSLLKYLEEARKEFRTIQEADINLALPDQA